MQSIREAGCSLKVIIVSNQEPHDIIDDFDFVHLLPEQIKSGMIEAL